MNVAVPARNSELLLNDPVVTHKKRKREAEQPKGVSGKY